MEKIDDFDEGPIPFHEEEVIVSTRPAWQIEFEAYRDIMENTVQPPVRSDQDLLQYWKRVRHQFPHMSILARWSLSV